MTWGDGVVVRLGEPLCRHTALRTGGPCDAFVVVHDPDALGDVLATCRERSWKVTILGAGTRTVYRDGEVPGAVVRLGTGFCTLGVEGDAFEAGAALPAAVLAAAALTAGRGGVEQMAALPGSLGAAILLDPAWDAVLESVTVCRRGRAVVVAPAEAREGGLPIVLSARFVLPADRPERIRDRMRAARQSGESTSVWHALRKGTVRSLLRRTDLNGVRLRQATLPEAAPEMLVNLGGARATDLDLVLKSAIDRVLRERGVKLEPRVRLAGRS